MAWVTWRQHRHQLLIGLALIVGLALAALVTGLPMRTAYSREALSSCLPPTARSGCDIIVRHFQAEYGSRVDIAGYLILLPALVACSSEPRSLRASWSTGHIGSRGHRA